MYKPTKEEGERIGFLQELCNKYGDLKVAIATRKPDGEIQWSKHRSVMELWHDDEKGFWFLAHANNRQILPTELILDIDENPNLDRVNEICDDLEILGSKYKAYHTGSKGYHIHIQIKELALKSKKYKEEFKEFFIDRYSCDLQKKSENTMIALENAPHWKTGKPKKLIRTNIK